MSAPSNSNVRRNWKTSHALIQAAICLVLGITIGFFLRGSRSAVATQVTATSSPDSASPTAKVLPITAERLKHMADKQAEPVLAQLKSKPNDPELLAKVGYVYYTTRNFKTASEYYKRSVDNKDDVIVRTELGRAYYYAGDPQSALAEFETILKSEPSNANALFNIGLIKWQQDFDADGAVAVWKLMLKKNPNHPRRTEVEQMIAQARQHSNLKAAGPSSSNTGARFH
jgi:cytochrome c-type biogenesis protein CcmH/NrfG